MKVMLSLTNKEIIKHTIIRIVKKYNITSKITVFNAYKELFSLFDL